MSLHGKLFAIQNEVKNPKKDTTGFNYSYATLDQVLDIIKPHLKEQQLLLLQNPTYSGDFIGIETRVIDVETSERFECDFKMIPVKRDPQAVGSVLTYLRRYSLLSIFNLAPIDDDGNAALEEPKKIIQTKKVNRFE